MSRITVRYTGGSSGSGPLTLGQDNMIRCIRRDDPEQINKQAVWPVPEGTDLPAALAALRALAERHESLRTVFPPGPDGFPSGQQVRAEGEFDVTVVEAGPLDGPALDAFAGELARTDIAVAFDLAEDFPLRFTLVTRDGRPVRMAVVVCHSGADGASTALLVQEWLLLASGKELPPSTARTPLEVAAAEGSALGRRRAKTSLRHWERVLRTSPQAVFAESRIVGPPDTVSVLILRSPAAARDLEAASQRTGATPSTVLLAAFAALVAHRADQSELVIAALSANRHRPGLADYVGTLAQDAFLAVDAGAEDLDELIGRTKAASLAGYWHSSFDADQVWRMIDDIAHRRGSRYARHVVVNDLSLTIPESAFDDAAASSAADPEISWFPDERIPTRLMFNIIRVGGSLEFALLTCPQVLDRAETEQFARGLLAVVAAAARGPLPLAGLGALTGVRPGVRTGDWRLVGGSWIDLDAVRALLGAVLAPEVRFRLDADGGPLTARLASADPDRLSPVEVHRAVVAALPNRDTAMAPQHYVVHRGPADPAADWDALPVVAEGDGRDPAVPDWEALLG
ncbi:condensation domain-containing protein [Streptacidiphilus cavernicola]|uniref:Condensation domain-containing protein n=1 Tax=Streptacidiphilus cavernicola TaxID=3342716 RepID=A0ABV6W0X2_9ACTN